LPHNLVSEMNWFDQMKRAYELAVSSPDPSTQNAALILDGTFKELVNGVNRFPVGVIAHPERWERPQKYEWVEHAERNAIYAAAKRGIRIDGMLMVCPWAACPDCARGIVQSGIKTLVTHLEAHEKTPLHWTDSVKTGLQILEEGKVEVVLWSGFAGGKEVRLNGEKWNP